MNKYQHTQVGKLQRVFLNGLAEIAGGSGIITAFRTTIRHALPMLLSSVVLSTCAFLFDAMTVKVSRTYVSITFGIGIIRKRFAIADIKKVTIVQNRWYYGWGIKLTPHGWLYNVSGLDAIEIQLSNGRKHRVGTDEPVKLHAVIQSSMLEQTG